MPHSTAAGEFTKKPFKLLVFLLALSVCAGCSSSAIKKSQATDQKIAQINLLAVRFFRPNYPVAGIEDFSRTDRKLSCIPSSELWADLLTPEKSLPILECLNSLNDTAHYLYIPKSEPYLEVDPLKKEKNLCLYTVLPQLKLPREVYFLGRLANHANQATFAMSLDTKANQVADIELRSPRFEIQLKFPISRKLETAHDLNLWLLTQVLSLFEEDESRTSGAAGISASVVPAEVAKSCFQNDPLFQDKHDGKIPPVFFP